MSEADPFTWGDGWVPAELVWFRGRPAVSMLRLPDNRPVEPFFHQTLARATGRPRLLLLDDAPSTADEFEPSGFLFHMMRCGSTLVSRLLAALPGTRVVSEPTLFYALFAQPDVAPAERRRWLRRLIGLYAHGLCGAGESLFIKWPSAMSRFIRTIEATYPDVAKVFLTRDPVEVLVSIAEARPGGSEYTKDEHLAPHLRAGSTAALQALPAWEGDARYIASCCYWASESRSLRVLDYRGLPAAIWNELATDFGLNLSAGDVRRLEELAPFYSKDPAGQRLFEPDADRKRRRASEALHEAAARLVEPELARLRARHRAMADGP